MKNVESEVKKERRMNGGKRGNDFIRVLQANTKYLLWQAIPGSVVFISGQSLIERDI